MRRLWTLLVLVTPWVLLCLFNVQARADQKAPAKDATPPARFADGALFQRAIRPFLAEHCVGCHGATKPKGGVDLSKLQDESQAARNRRLWTKVKENVEGGLMPPDERPQPPKDRVEAVVKWIDGELNQADCGRSIDPGRVTIRRLNRAEYNNTIRDLVGIDFRPADDFPSDDVGYGFDNIGDVLTIPPILMEKYLAAAEAIADQVIIAGASSHGPIKAWDAQGLDDSAGGSAAEDGRILTSQGAISVRHDFPRDGTYILRFRAYGHQAGPEPAKMAVLIDDKPLKSFDVKAVAGAPGNYEHRARLRGGKRRLSAAFLNDYYKPDDPDPNHRDRNLIVETIEVEGPLHASGDPLPASHKAIIFRSPKKPEEVTECASAVLQKFAMRAYRRPVTGGELAKLMRLVDLAHENGDSFERGIQLAVQAVLVSPQFLFRVELNRGRKRSAGKSDPSIGIPLNPFEVASRLSYFLWSSMPDDELSKLALDGSLLKPEVLALQVRRMVRDPRAQALVENFADQWLQLRLLKSATPDKERFPGFDEPLREAMQKETELFFASVMREDRSILDFLDCDYSFLNERLARHYGVPGVSGEKFRLVHLKGKARGGLVTQASVLTVTSNPTRTSPVKRGRWVLEQVLGLRQMCPPYPTTRKPR
jgi:hypothetical protein